MLSIWILILLQECWELFLLVLHNILYQVTQSKLIKISLNTNDHETASWCSCSLPLPTLRNTTRIKNEVDRSEVFWQKDTWSMPWGVYEWVCLNIKKKLFQPILQEANLIFYESHFHGSWFCSQHTILPFRFSFWINMMPLHISSWTLLTSSAKINLKTLFTLCNNLSINWQWLI